MSSFSQKLGGEGKKEGIRQGDWNICRWKEKGKGKLREDGRMAKIKRLGMSDRKMGRVETEQR